MSRNYIIFVIGIVALLVILGYMLNGDKYLAEGFREGHGGGHLVGRTGDEGREGGRLVRNRGTMEGDHAKLWRSDSPPTFGRINNLGYYPVYTRYEYPVYYVNPRHYYEISDSNGIFYYFTNIGAFLRRLFGLS